MSTNRKTLAMLTGTEVRDRRRISAKEREAIADLIRAIRRLPTTLCADIDEDGLIIRKRITRGYAVRVACVKRKSLTF